MRCAVLLLLPLAAAAVEIEPADYRERPEVEVDGHPVRAGGNLTILDDRLALHPFALAGGGYDRAGAPGQESGSTFSRLLAGMEGDGDLGPVDRLGGRLDAIVQRYDASARADRLGGTARAWWLREGEGLRLRTSGGIERRDEIPAQVGADVASVRAGGSAALRATGERHVAGIEVQGWDVRSLEGTAYYAAEQRRLADAAIAATWGIRTGDDLWLSLRLDVRRLDYRDEAVFPDQDRWSAAGAARLALGERSWAQAAAGWERWRGDASFRRDPARADADAGIPAGALTMRLSWEEGSYLEAEAARHLVESLSSNAAVGEGVSLLGRARLSASWGVWLRLEASRQRDEAVAASEGPMPDDRRNLEARLVGEWLWDSGVQVRPRLLAIDSRSRTGDDYRRLQAALELAVAW